MLQGLLIAPRWLLALIDNSLDAPHWHFDLIALTEPQTYLPERGRICYFERESVYRALNSPPLLWEHQGRISFTQRRHSLVEETLTPQDYHFCSQGFWHPSLKAQKIFERFFCYEGTRSFHWHESAIEPWLSLLASRSYLSLSAIAELTREVLAEREEAPLIEYYDQKWWFQGKRYDFCVLFSTKKGVGKCLRPIFWSGGEFCSYSQQGAQRLERFLRYDNEPLWQYDLQKGLFQAPLYWPVQLELLQRQWSLLATHLYTFQGVLSF